MLQQCRMEENVVALVCAKCGKAVVRGNYASGNGRAQVMSSVTTRI